MKALSSACLAALFVGVACSPEPTPLPGAAALSVIGSGTFECGLGAHGCTAWFIVRPAGWAPPEGWNPGPADATLEVQGGWSGQWVVSGPSKGGPGALAPGDYWFAVAYSDISDTEPPPTMKYLSTTIACTLDFTVPSGTQRVAVSANFGPACRIDAKLDPAP